MNPANLSCVAIQSNLHWENKEANLHMFSEKLRAYTSPADVFLLPEMFSTGFTMNAGEFAEAPNGPTFQWMQQQAQLKNAAIAGSYIVTDGDKFYNRLVWVNPDGTFFAYNKRHLFRMANEDKHYSAGDQRVIIDYKGWKICLMVCYDLRFPVWSRNRFSSSVGKMEAEYDLLIYVANWPERRSYAWKTLLAARAIENLAYVIGVNRIGNDGNFVYHSGDTSIINPRGEILKQGIISAEEMVTASLSMQDLEQFRKSFPAGMDADDFSIK
jgi:omega-amidase